MKIDIYIPQLIASAIALVLLYLCKYILSNLVKKYGQLLQKSVLRRQQMKQMLSILLNVLFVFILAIIWGVQPHNLLISLSSIFAVIGVAMFAQWSLLSNITAGIVMYFNAPFRIGDHIRILDKDFMIEAVIENIRTFYTHIRTQEGELIVIPNNLFLQKMVSIKKKEE